MPCAVWVVATSNQVIDKEYEMRSNPLACVVSGEPPPVGWCSEADRVDETRARLLVEHHLRMCDETPRETNAV